MKPVESVLSCVLLYDAKRITIRLVFYPVNVHLETADDVQCCVGQFNDTVDRQQRVGAVLLGSCRSRLGTELRRFYDLLETPDAADHGLVDDVRLEKP